MLSYNGLWNCNALHQCNAAMRSRRLSLSVVLSGKPVQGCRDTARNPPMLQIRTQHSIQDVSWSARTSDRFATCNSSTNAIHIWNAATGQEQMTLRAHDPVGRCTGGLRALQTVKVCSTPHSLAARRCAHHVPSSFSQYSSSSQPRHNPVLSERAVMVVMLMHLSVALELSPKDTMRA